MAELAVDGCHCWAQYYSKTKPTIFYLHLVLCYIFLFCMKNVFLEVPVRKIISKYETQRSLLDLLADYSNYPDWIG